MAGHPPPNGGRGGGAAYADTFDYYYVPCYYVDGVKVHEGHAERADVEAVFRAAAGEPAGV